MREKGMFAWAPRFVVAPHTLVSTAKSSGKRAILWLIRPPNDHLRIRKRDGRRLVRRGEVSRTHQFESSWPTNPAVALSACEFAAYDCFSAICGRADQRCKRSPFRPNVGLDPRGSRV